MRKIKSYLIKFFIGLFFTLVSVWIYLSQPYFFTAVENKLYDMRYKIRGDENHGEHVVIAAIDNKSLKEFGRFPWDRKVFADLIYKLYDLGAVIIASDVLFIEPHEHDQILADAMFDAGNVFLPFSIDSKAIKGFVKTKDFMRHSMLDVANIEHLERFKEYEIFTYASLLPPRQILLESAIATGHIAIKPDEDGTVRWDMSIIRHQGNLYPSLDLLVATYYLGMSRKDIHVDAAKSISIGKHLTMETDGYGRTPIYYYGGSNTFRTYSILDILKDKIPEKAIKGKIVYIGSIAEGAYDLRVSPFSHVMPGVYKHAHFVTSVIEKKLMHVVSDKTNLLVIIGVGLLFSFISSFYMTNKAFLITVLTVAGVFLGINRAFQDGYWVNLTIPVFNIALIMLFHTLYSYRFQESETRAIRGLFSSYVTEKVVDELVKKPEMAKLGGQYREITVLFSDIVGFTSFSEKHTPEEVVGRLNEYLTEMTEVVLKWDGTLDKFVGDEIMAFWGAPVIQEDHAELAANCALEMIDRLNVLQEKWEAEGKPALDCGIGLNSGEVIVGNIGSERKKMDYTIIGDTVNLGARLEAQTRNYDTKIIISEFTKNMIEDKGLDASIDMLDEIKVKGKDIPVKIYSIHR